MIWITLKGVKTFLGLTDTPSSYSGQAGKVAAVNSGEAALEFISAMKYSDTRFKGGIFTRDTSLASGTQAVTGVGFTPVAVLFLSCENNAVGEASIGIDDASIHYAISDNTTITTDVWKRHLLISVHDAHSSGNVYDGYVTSLDSNGFTVDWTKYGTPTGTLSIIYLAFR